jgi:hypothetical protein
MFTVKTQGNTPQQPALSSDCQTSWASCLSCFASPGSVALVPLSVQDCISSCLPSTKASSPASRPPFPPSSYGVHCHSSSPEQHSRLGARICMTIPGVCGDPPDLFAFGIFLNTVLCLSLGWLGPWSSYLLPSQVHVIVPSFLLVEMGVSRSFCPGWPQTMILSMFISQISRITDVSHPA